MTFDKRFYGVYKGIVVDNNDLELRKRLTVKVPQVTGDAVTGWAEVCINGSGVTAPSVNDIVWISYIAGDPNFPVWIGVTK
jgi:hypothetical protein